MKPKKPWWVTTPKEYWAPEWYADAVKDGYRPPHGKPSLPRLDGPIEPGVTGELLSAGFELSPARPRKSSRSYHVDALLGRLGIGRR